MSSFWCRCLFRSGCEPSLLTVDEKQKQTWFAAKNKGPSDSILVRFPPPQQENRPFSDKPGSTYQVMIGIVQAGNDVQAVHVHVSGH